MQPSTTCLPLLLAAIGASLWPLRRRSGALQEGASTGGEREGPGRRRLRAKDAAGNDNAVDDGWFADVPRALSLAARPRPPSFENLEKNGQERLRVLVVTTSLAEYDRGTRGTNRGYDRLRHVVLPPLVDSVSSMMGRGWDIDVYLVLGYARLAPNRRDMIRGALPRGVGLEVWEDAMPLHYANTYNKRPRKDQSLKVADHALSRQHRFVLRDKLPFYDLFVCFEDDMKITAEHVVNFLQLSYNIKQLHDRALSNSDGHAHVSDPSPPRSDRHRPNDKASVGNDVVDDPISAECAKRLFPGLLRVEVLDRQPDHPMRRPGLLENHSFAKEVPPSTDAFDADGESVLKPTICCNEGDPPRGKMTSHPRMDELVLWETNIQATGVRRFPEPVGWAAAMPVEDRSDVGSFWSGYPSTYGGENAKRPRRIDVTLGQQAGFMATRSQIQYFHERACPGGFLPPYDSQHWRGDSLQRHSVEFWSGGFQLFGQCYLNRVLSLDPRVFERQLIYHVSNNKQRTISPKKIIRVADFYGQIVRVKERAEVLVGTP